MNLEYFIAGVPKAQPRPRACKRGRHVGVFNPDTADEWKTLIKLASRNQMGVVPPVQLPCAVAFLFVMPRPVNHWNKNGLRPGAPTYHTTKPDADNLAKAALDAMTGIVWHDDNQVCDLKTVKTYADSPEEVGLIVQLNTL